MFKLTPEAPVSEARPQGPRRARLPWLLLAQLMLLAGFVALMLEDQDVAGQPGPEQPSRVRYKVSQAEWPNGAPTLKQIHDRYAGDLPAMQVANQPGSCADPEARIDYGDVVFIEFAPAGDRCQDNGRNAEQTR